MGFFGYLGLLNCLFSIPILFGLVYGGLLDTSGLTNRTARARAPQTLPAAHPVRPSSAHAHKHDVLLRG